MGQHQKLHGEFDIDHAAGAVLDIKNLRFGFVAGAHAFAHGMDLFAQGGLVAWAGDDACAHCLKAYLQGAVAQDAARPCHGLVFPGPSGVGAALLLVIGVGGKAADQQAGVAVRPQGGVDLVQIAFAGFDREPVDDFAHQHGVDLARVVVHIVVHKDQVQVAAVAQLFAAELAVGDDGHIGAALVRVFQTPPAPAQRQR